MYPRIFSCPYFRNEVGGEEETLIALTRETGKLWGAETDGERKVTCIFFMIYIFIQYFSYFSR